MDGQIQPISTARFSAPLQNFCIWLAITAVVTIVCYFWLDQPLALFLHRNIADRTVFVWLQRLPVTFPLLSSLILAWCGLWTLMDRSFSRVQSVALTCSISFISTSLINHQLKYAFGRTWTNTWIENNPSLIQNGAFGFNPFHGGLGFASFPAAICSVMTVLWRRFGAATITSAPLIAGGACQWIAAGLDLGSVCLSSLRWNRCRGCRPR